MGAGIKTFSNPEISAFCTQMAMILKSGISVTEGISILSADSSGEMQEFYSSLSAWLERGTSLGTALKESGRFPVYACDMTEIGIESGRTDEIMEALAVHYEREEETLSAIRSAVTYPAVMIGMMFLVILVLITKVLPVFDQVFQQLGSRLTGVSGGLLQLGTILMRYSAVFVFLLALLAVFLIWLGRTQKGRALSRRLLYLLPPIRKLSQKLAASRYASGLSIALKSGLNMEDSMQMAQKVASDPVIWQKAAACLEAYRSGSSLPEAIKAAGLFSGLFSRMLSVGFQAGAAEQVLQKIAEQYDSESEEQLSSIISILEPTLVAVLSCIVGLILLSVMLPLLGIMSGVTLF